MTHPIFTEDHDLIRAQLRRFVEEKVKPARARSGRRRASCRARCCARWASSASSRCACPRRWAARASMPAPRSCWPRRSAARPMAASPSPCWSIPTWRARISCASAPSASSRSTCRASWPARPSPPSASPSPAPAPTSPAIRTRAVRDGNDYVLNGTKMFITNGVHGDLYFIAARTDPEAKGSRAITMFIVEKGTPGFKVGRALDKTGWRSLGHRRADLRGLPRAGRERAGRAQPRLLLDHGQLPDRAAGDRRHGHGRGARGDPAHLRVCQPAHRLRRAAVGQAGDPPAPVAPAGRGRGGAPARASHGLARCPGPRIASPRSRWSRRWPATW